MFHVQQEIVFAALPPWVQEEREKKAIYEDPRLKGFLECVHGHVEEIHTVVDGYTKYYIVSVSAEGRDCYCVRVNVRYIPQKLMGPQKFELEFFFPDGYTP